MVLEMEIKKEGFGSTKEGQEVFLYTLQNQNGMQAKVTNYGAILTSLLLPDADGKLTDVVLGYDSVEPYEQNGSFFGATVGRSANRIAGAKFEIDGVTYQLDVNDGPNNLHSQFEIGFHKQIWEVKEDSGQNSVAFFYVSKDGEAGFPGTLDISVTYVLTEENALEIHYHGVSDRKTLINCTNHSYFNLSGHDAGNIEDHKLWLNATHYTPVVAGAIPTGEIAPVEGTPMDFTKQKRIGDEIESDFEQLKLVHGYDHNFVCDIETGHMEKIAEVTDEKAKRAMEVHSDLPGIQFYAGNCISDTVGKNGVTYTKRSGLCLETQYFPNSVNQEGFQSPIFDAGEEYQTTTIYKFRNIDGGME